MSADIFSLFDPESNGQNPDPGVQEFHVPGSDPTQNQPDPTAEGGTGGNGGNGADPNGGEPAGDTIQIKKEEWDRTQQMLAEFRGFMAAAQNQRQQPEPQRYEPQPVRPDPAQQQAQLDQLAESLGNDLITNPKEGVKKILAIGAQLAAAQAQQYSAPAQSSTVDLMIENFVTRKAAKDPLYDKGVGERFEDMLKTIDTRAVAGANRQQINEAMETLYQRAKGDWADAQYAEAQKRKPAPKGEPTNYGGGRSSSTGGQRASAIPDTWRQFALAAGIPESEITPEMFQEAE